MAIHRFLIWIWIWIWIIDFMNIITSLGGIPIMIRIIILIWSIIFLNPVRVIWVLIIVRLNWVLIPIRVIWLLIAVQLSWFLILRQVIWSLNTVQMIKLFFDILPSIKCWLLMVLSINVNGINIDVNDVNGVSCFLALIYGKVTGYKVTISLPKSSLKQFSMTTAWKWCARFRANISKINEA